MSKIESEIITQQQMIELNNAIKKLPEKKARDLLTYCIIRTLEFEVLAKTLSDKKILTKTDIKSTIKKLDSKKKIDEFIKKLK